MDDYDCRLKQRFAIVKNMNPSKGVPDMLDTTMQLQIKQICKIIEQRITDKHISCFSEENKPLFMISDQYPGVWLEHVYDSVLYAKLFPGNNDLAVNTIHLFLDYQQEDGHLPYCIVKPDYAAGKEPAKAPVLGNVRYTQIQECLSFGQLCLEVYHMTQDQALLQKAYNGVCKWFEWLHDHRMTMHTGLIEMFVGFDTGHDNSGRLEGISCPRSLVIDGVRMDASVLPEDNTVPILAVDMNANYYATAKALAKMAGILGYAKEADTWEKHAAEIKKKLFEICFEKEDCFFYDVDKKGQKRKYLSSTIFHLFMEKVLDPAEDKALIKEIYQRHIKNPEEFWTEYPFPSMAISDKSFRKHTEFNCWGYYSQGLIALRCIRWMDTYGMSEDFDTLCEKWLSAWTRCYDTFKFGQELDPITGEPSASSEWYSSCMLFYIYAARRLGITDGTCPAYEC